EIEASEFSKRGRKSEIQLIQTLLASEDARGTIGRIAQERLKFLPSTIYWSALGRWGIRRFQGSQDAYHRSMDRWYKVMLALDETDDGDWIGPEPYNWDPSLPDAPAGFPKNNVSMQLTGEEAEYLRERLLSSCP